MPDEAPTPKGETIVALATPPGKSAVAVVRLSGPESLSYLKAVSPESSDLTGVKRTQTLVHLSDLRGHRIDRVLASYFPAPHSYTGEDVVEISCHGSPWICRRIIETAHEFGIRLAQPGEFTLRAFLAGKIDLLQAEAVRDLIAAETEFQARVAREQLEGRLSRRLEPFKEVLVHVISHLETRLEFVEDELDPEDEDVLLVRLRWLAEGLEQLEGGYLLGRFVSQGFQVVLAGSPNVGKSSIFNALMDKERAIVTTVPGTTRDALSERLNIRGVPVELVDTAGIREISKAVERLGIEKTLEYVASCEVVLFVVDSSREFGADDQKCWAAVEHRPVLMVLNKIDLPRRVAIPQSIEGACRCRIEVSAKEGTRIGELAEAIWRAALGEDVSEREGALITSLRQRECVRDCRLQVEEGCQALEGGLSEEYALFHLHRGLEALGRLTGEVTVDDLLGRIFSTFCIGK